MWTAQRRTLGHPGGVQPCPRRPAAERERGRTQGATPACGAAVRPAPAGFASNKRASPSLPKRPSARSCLAAPPPPPKCLTGWTPLWGPACPLPPAHRWPAKLARLPGGEGGGVSSMWGVEAANVLCTSARAGQPASQVGACPVFAGNLCRKLGCASTHCQHEQLLCCCGGGRAGSPSANFQTCL